MSAEIPESHKDLLENPIVATLTTVSADGKPQSTVLWKKFEDGAVKFSTVATRKKVDNLKENPNVTVMVIDPQNPYRYIEVRGQADINRDGAFDFVDELTQMFTDEESFYGGIAPAEGRETDDRIIIKVTPDHVVTYG